MEVQDNRITAYHVDVSFLVVPRMGSGRHSFVFATTQEPTQDLSERIVRKIANPSFLGTRIDAPSFEKMENRQEWRYTGVYHDAADRDGSVRASVTMKSLGNLISGLDDRVLSVNGRLRYRTTQEGEEFRLLPIYDSVNEIS